MFPLLVKLLLEREGHYDLTDDDRVHGLAVDQILAAPRWFDEESEDSDERPWTAADILFDIRRKFILNRAWRNAQEKLAEGRRNDSAG